MQSHPSSSYLYSITTDMTMRIFLTLQEASQLTGVPTITLLEDIATRDKDGYARLRAFRVLSHDGQTLGTWKIWDQDLDEYCQGRDIHGTMPYQQFLELTVYPRMASERKAR